MIFKTVISRRAAWNAALGALCLFTGVAAAHAQSTTDWMVGTWTGTGSQTGTGSHWSMSLTVQRQGANLNYKIDYPSLNCGGYWTLIDATPAKVSFTEHITYGRDKCVDLGAVTIAEFDKAPDSPVVGRMAFRWVGTQPNEQSDYADAVLTRS